MKVRLVLVKAALLLLGSIFLYAAFLHHDAMYSLSLKGVIVLFIAAWGAWLVHEGVHVDINEEVIDDQY